MYQETDLDDVVREAVDPNSRAYKACVSLLEQSKNKLPKQQISEVVLVEYDEDIDADEYPDELSPLVTLHLHTKGSVTEGQAYRLRTNPEVNNVHLLDKKTSRAKDYSISSIMRDFFSGCVSPNRSNEEITSLHRGCIDGQSKEQKMITLDSSRVTSSNNFIEEILALPQSYSRTNDSGDTESLDPLTQAKISKTFEDSLKGFGLVKKNNGFNRVCFNLTGTDKLTVFFVCDSNPQNSFCSDL